MAQDNWFDQFQTVSDDDFFNQFESVEDEPASEEDGFLESAWKFLSSPLTDLPSRVTKNTSETLFKPLREGLENKYVAGGLGFLEGANEGLGDLLSSFTSPIDLATTALTAGSSGALRAGYKGASKGLETAAKLSAVPMGIHGAGNVISPESTLMERGMGLAELAGAGVPFIPGRVTPKPKSDPLAGLIEHTDVTEPRFKIDPPENTYRQGAYEQIPDDSFLTDSAGNPIETDLGFPSISRSRIGPERDAFTKNPANLEPGIVTSRVNPPPDRPVPDYELRDSGGNPMVRMSPYESRSRKLTPTDDGLVDISTGDVIVPTDLKPKSLSPDNEIEMPQSPIWNAINFPRAVQAAYDISFPFRQGLGLIHTKGWRNSWGAMVKSYGSKEAYDSVISSIRARPLFQRGTSESGKEIGSFAERMGLKLVDLGKDLSKREEALSSTWAEKIWGVKASNRAYTAFANKLRADTFESLMNQAKRMAGSDKNLDPFLNETIAKQIAEFVNTASGRGSLGRWEKNAVELNAAFFSPRLIASRLKYLSVPFDPRTYTMMNPLVRQQYLKSGLSMAAFWTSMAAIGNELGADVSLDPDSADFGKIKIGDTRLDPAGGFQQYLVLFHKLLSQEKTSTITGRTRKYNSGPGSTNWPTDAMRFVQQKTSPLVKYATDPLFATKKYPFEVGDKTLRLVTPIILQDLSELAQEDPELLPLLGLTSIGIGSNTYTGEADKPLIPESWGWDREKDFSFPRR